MNSNLRIVIAAFVSMLFIIAWQNFTHEESTTTEVKILESTKKDGDDHLISAEQSRPVGVKEDENKKIVTFRNNLISGSINLVGARIDNLDLLKYREEINDNKHVSLLSPPSSKNPYYAELGWISDDPDLEIPTRKSVWSSNKNDFGPNDNITLSWKNSKGIEYVINFHLDESYMFTIEQKVIGLQNKKVSCYAAINKSLRPDNQNQMMVHEGGIGVFGNKLKEITFEKLNKSNHKFPGLDDYWFGFSDKYWLTAIAVQGNSTSNAQFSSYRINGQRKYQADAIISNTQNNYNKIYLFTGAKELKLLEHYKEKFNIKLFDRAVDFGILYFITKPIFIMLNYLHTLVQNFGVAIILLTFFIKTLLFPLAYKGFAGMNKIKKIQPELARLKSLYKNDKQKFQISVVELYKREKVNPVSGCLPILIQMPIFFALYKVLYVTIEMRHAKFCLWINNLSSPDPTNIFTLFGMINWNPPSFFNVGVLPIIMALTLYGQQVLGPQHSDENQVKVMRILPLVFLFMFASFPSGLVLYWSCSNILSIVQQLLIKKFTK